MTADSTDRRNSLLILLVATVCIWRGKHERGFTPKQMAELWECWESGQCVADSRPSGGTRAVSIEYCSSATPESSGERCCSDRLNPHPESRHSRAWLESARN